MLLLLLFLTGSKLRVGPGSRRHQEDPERRSARRERQGRQGQVQDPPADPPGQHQAENRRVRVHVRTDPPTPAHLYRPTLKAAALMPFGGCLTSTAFVCSFRLLFSFGSFYLPIPDPDPDPDPDLYPETPEPLR